MDEIQIVSVTKCDISSSEMVRIPLQDIRFIKIGSVIGGGDMDWMDRAQDKD
jgi:hypothetical protein